MFVEPKNTAHSSQSATKVASPNASVKLAQNGAPAASTATASNKSETPTTKKLDLSHKMATGEGPVSVKLNVTTEYAKIQTKNENSSYTVSDVTIHGDASQVKNLLSDVRVTIDGKQSSPFSLNLQESSGNQIYKVEIPLFYQPETQKFVPLMFTNDGGSNQIESPFNISPYNLLLGTNTSLFARNEIRVPLMQNISSQVFAAAPAIIPAVITPPPKPPVDVTSEGSKTDSPPTHETPVDVPQPAAPPAAPPQPLATPSPATPPTDITLTPSAVNENVANGTVVGTLNTTDPMGGSFTYTLLNDAGGRFVIVGNEVRVVNGLLLDTEAANSHNITIRTTNAGGLSYTEIMAVTVSNVNEAISYAGPIADQFTSVGLGLNYVFGNGAFTDIDLADTKSYTGQQWNGAAWIALPAWMTFDNATHALQAAPAAATQGVYTVRVTATDSGGLTATSGSFLVAIANNVNYGTGAGEVLLGNGTSEVIIGLGGNDNLGGAGGSDSLFGGAGADILEVSRGGGWVTAYFNDTILYDFVQGVDTIRAWQVNFTTIAAGAGSDGSWGYTYNAGTNLTTISDEYNDMRFHIVGNVAPVIGDFAFVDRYVGTAGADNITGAGGHGSIFGLDGNDTLVGAGPGGNNYVIWGGNGDDDISTLGNTIAAYGGSGNDTITGGAQGDRIRGEENDDQIFGAGGNDNLFGGDGNDTVDGGNNDDYIEGGDGDDSILGGTGNDTIGTGSFDNGNDTIYGGAGNDILRAGSQDDIVYGEDGNDTFLDHAGNDTFYGGNNDDTVTGAGSGNDQLFGEAGNDQLYSTVGTDSLTGGTGADRFQYAGVTDSGIGAGNRDIIADFSQAETDRFDFSLFAGVMTFRAGGNGAGDFVGSVSQVAFQQVGGNTILYVDSTGDNATDFEIEITGLFAMVVGDFIL